MLKILRVFLIIIALVSLTYFGIKAYSYATTYESITKSIAKQSDANGLAQGKLDRFTSVISFGLIKDKTKTLLDSLKIKQSRNKKETLKNLYYFMIILSITLLFSFSCTLIANTLVLAITSLISLIFGLINPILMVTIHKQVEYLGDVILSFESKGILGSIIKLFENDERVIAFTILLFSVIIPLFKIATLIFTLIFRNYKFSHHLVNFFKHIGKWSMIDVFVVASLLVYLTSNSKDVSHAEIEIGLYFFLAYVILSMITTLRVQRVLDKQL